MKKLKSYIPFQRQSSRQTDLNSVPSYDEDIDFSTSINLSGTTSSDVKKVIARKMSKADSMRLASSLPDPSTMQNAIKKAEDVDFEYHAAEYRPPRDTCQRAFYQIAESKTFDRFILLCIIVNSVTLAFYDPRELSPIDEQIPLEFLDNFFLGVFTLEMIIKVCASPPPSPPPSPPSCCLCVYVLCVH